MCPTHPRRALSKAAISLSVTLAAVIPAVHPAAAQGTAAGAARQGSARTRLATDSVLVRQERALWEALRTEDTTAFPRILGSRPSFLLMHPGGIERYASAVALAKLLAAQCEMRSATADSIRVEHVDDDTALLTYKATVDRTCGGQKAPPDFYVMSVWARRQGRWEMAAQSAALPQAPNTPVGRPGGP